VWRIRFHQTQLRIPAALIARVVHECFAQENRGRGECRVRVAPAASRANVLVAHERSHRRQRRDHPAFPHAMVLTAYIVLSPVSEFVLSPSSAD
jgi:hypothetical protein